MVLHWEPGGRRAASIHGEALGEDQELGVGPRPNMKCRVEDGLDRVRLLDTFFHHCYAPLGKREKRMWECDESLDTDCVPGQGGVALA